MKRFGRVNRLTALIIAAISIMLQQNISVAATCPCDIYAAAGDTCVAAHSTVRLLLSTYTGPLYQVRRSSDNTTKDIYTVSGGTAADGPSQDAFCSGTCVITKIYDQSGHGNFLEYQGAGSSVGGQDQPANATSETFSLSGHKVYSLYINPGNSYWRNGSTTHMPLGSAPEGMYMVTAGNHYNGGCCYDYGNSETTRAYAGAGAMDALSFTSITSWGTGAGNGPWIMADLEAGIFSQGAGGKNNNDPTQTSRYVTAVLKNNGTSTFALKGGNAQSGGLTTYYNGALPSGGWTPMKKQGAIVLGSGGDCCNTNTNMSDGTFYEGAIVSGYPSDATENSVQANIVAAGYGSTSQVTWYNAGGAATAPLFKVNYNPSMSAAIISYTLQDARRVSMNIFNQQGRHVAAIVNGVMPAGRHDAVWDAKLIRAGVYICRTAIDGLEGWTGKIVVEK
ncbi:MAG: arabinofuranosidase catalytic domain-containing protein [Chitinispirillaceae bacterium]|jgi:hypothetical protein